MAGIVPLNSVLTGLSEDVTKKRGVGAPTGRDGREVQFQVADGNIQWRYVGSPAWTDLIALSELIGAAGLDGKTVLSGPDAPDDEGEDGDFYIRTSNWTIYGPKTAGAWGSAVSLIGPAVADGRTVLNGTTAPANGLGEDGDFYIRTSNWTIYGPKASGTWGSATSIFGPTGPAGNTVLSWKCRVMAGEIELLTRRLLSSVVGHDAAGLAGRQSVAALMSPYARNFKKLLDLDIANVMASPPTITVGVNGAVSAITGAANGTMSLAATDAKITYAGSPSFSSPATGYQTGVDRTNYRVRFRHIGRRFEFRMRAANGNTRLSHTVYIDGKLAYAGWPAGVVTTGAADQLVLVDFGANTETFEAVAFGSNGAAGSGYAVGDIITLAGGTGTAATIRVLTVSGGAITAFRLETLGAYSVMPTNPVAQASTTGSGTGATFNLIRGSVMSTRKQRLVEIVFGRGTHFGGLNIDSGDVIQPAPNPPLLPKRSWIGDSWVAGIYAKSPGMTFTQFAARMLGDCEDTQYGWAGMGWAGGSSQVGQIRSTILSLMGAAIGDRATLLFGTNDAGASAGTLTTNVAGELNYYLAQRPNIILTVVIGFSGIGATEASAIAAGVAGASDQNRVRVVNMYDVVPGSLTDWKTGDNSHMGQGGHNSLAPILAERVAQAESEMLALLAA